MHLNNDIFKELTKPEKRLPWISRWLLTEIWSDEAWSKYSPEEYLTKGEVEVNDFEQIVSSCAPRIYDEIIVEAKNNPTGQLLTTPGNAVVVFDGLSLRELPILRSLCRKSGFAVKELKTAHSAIPSETLDYVERTFASGRISPSQLPSRKNLKERGIQSYYFESPAQRNIIEMEGQSLLLWSAFPDNTYNDSGARFVKHFENNQLLLEEAWKNIVQQIPEGMNIVITSDHGYIFFGSGCSFARGSSSERQLTEIFGGDRSLFFDEEPPKNQDIYLINERKLALIKGRIQTHPPGQGSTKLYKHGGLSLMECIVPWLVIERGAVSER